MNKLQERRAQLKQAKSATNEYEAEEIKQSQIRAEIDELLEKRLQVEDVDVVNDEEDGSKGFSDQNSLSNPDEEEDAYDDRIELRPFQSPYLQEELDVIQEDQHEHETLMSELSRTGRGDRLNSLHFRLGSEATGSRVHTMHSQISPSSAQ